MPITPNDPIVIEGAGTALFIMTNKVGPAFTELPMTKTDVKLTGEKTEVTGSFSLAEANSTTKIWSQYGEGKSGGTVSWQSFWLTGQIVAPMDIWQGDTYRFRQFVRRPGWLNGGDLGSCYDDMLFIDDKSMSLDPKTGVISWDVTTTANGAIFEPE